MASESILLHRRLGEKLREKAAETARRFVGLCEFAGEGERGQGHCWLLRRGKCVASKLLRGRMEKESVEILAPRIEQLITKLKEASSR